MHGPIQLKGPVIRANNVHFMWADVRIVSLSLTVISHVQGHELWRCLYWIAADDTGLMTVCQPPRTSQGRLHSSQV